MSNSRSVTLKSRARSLRRNATDAEKRLWSALQGRRLGGWKWRRQVPISGYIVDFFCPAARLVVEVDGGQHDVQASYDAARTRRLESLGLRVLRFWNHQVLQESDDVAWSSSRPANAARAGALRKPSSPPARRGERVG